MTKSQKRREKTERMISSLLGKDVPVISEQDYKVSLINVLNYHNVWTDPKVIQRGVVAYLKQNGMVSYIPAVNATSDADLRQIGILILHLQRGDYLADKERTFIQSKLDAIKDSYKSPVVAIKPVKDESKRDRVLDQARAIASSIDAEIDGLFTKASTGEFSIDVLLKTNNATQAVSKRIVEFYTNQIKELKSLISGDAYLQEAYSITKPHAKRILAFLENVVNVCLQNAETIKAQKVRKPRAKKKKSPAVLVSKLQYLKEFAELKLKSIDPKDVIGAKQVWFYNVKYKKLTRLVADNAEGLTVKGTTIVGFNLEESECKRVRKPEMIFGEITKKALNHHMKKMKTKECEPNGRINKETIILAV